MTESGIPSLLDLLGPAERNLLASSSLRRSYQDGNLVHDFGDEIAAMGIVVQGQIRLERQLQNGKAVGLTTYGPGQIFGQTAYKDAESARSTRPYRAIAMQYNN